MNYDFKQTLLSRCLFSGLIVGFAAVIANFIYDFIYRAATSFAPSEVVNIPFIIFSSLIVTVIASVLFYLFSKMNNGTTIYIVLFILLTALGVYAASQTMRTNVPIYQHEFRILFAGLIIIDGLCAAFLVPYFTNHRKIYSE